MILGNNKEEIAQQAMIDKIILIGRCYVMEINMEKNKNTENFQTTFSSKTYD
jgi:hypothetical protein